MKNPISITRNPITYKSTGNPRYDHHILIPCKRCGEYFLPRSPRTQYCDDCQHIHGNEAAKERWIKNGRKQTSAKNWQYMGNRKVYVPSGYHQKGENNNAYKNGKGVNWYQEALKILPEKCNRCGSTGDDSLKIRDLLLHHKDGNHYNNSPDNWEILCKRCHQNHHSKHGSDGRFVSSKS